MSFLIQIQILTTKVNGPQKRAHAFVDVFYQLFSTTFHRFYSRLSASILLMLLSRKDSSFDANSNSYDESKRLTEKSTCICRRVLPGVFKKFSPFFSRLSASMLLMLLSRKDSSFDANSNCYDESRRPTEQSTFICFIVSYKVLYNFSLFSLQAIVTPASMM